MMSKQSDETKSTELPPPSDPDVLTVEQTAKLLGLSIHSVYNAVSKGQIPHRRIGRRLLFSRGAILTWLQGSPGRK
jgi:excisionase family DNA binding protein